jgi:hypothetical protein
MKRVQVIAARVAVLAGLLVAGVGVSAALADPGNGNGPPSSPPGQGECQHGNSGQDCKPDPQPEHGKECESHGNQGGVDEDHCLGTTDSTTTTEATTTTDETTTTDQPTTTVETTTTTDETTTTDQPTTTVETTTTKQPTTTDDATTTSQPTTNATPTPGTFTPPDEPSGGQETTPAGPTTNLHEVLSKETTRGKTSPLSDVKGTRSDLPFTGFPAWIVEGFGLLLLVAGLLIRRLAH